MTKASYRIEDLFPAMHKESDLGLMTMGTVVIEHALRSVLESAFGAKTKGTNVPVAASRPNSSNV